MELLTDMEMDEVVGGLQIIATVGINSPKDPLVKDDLPGAAAESMLGAFTNVVLKGPGELTNTDIPVIP